MNKKNIFLAALIALLGLSFTACKDDEPAVAKAVMCSVSQLNFPEEGDGVEITVVSDAEWHAVVPEWITISPEKGSGTTLVTVTAKPNYEDDGELGPVHRDELIFCGNTLASQAIVICRQAGDKYKNKDHMTAAQIEALTDEDYVVMNDAVVTALFSDGFMVNEGAGNVYVKSTEKPAVGTAVTIRGQKFSDVYKMANVEAEDVIAEGTAPAMPVATNITANKDSYKPTTREFFSIEGMFNGKKVFFEDSKTEFLVLEGADGSGIAALGGHNVVLSGYFAGMNNGNPQMLATAAEDKGSYETIYFLDDFEWLDPWASLTPAGQTVETNDPDATAQQLGTNKVDDVSTYDALLAAGYEFPFCCSADKSPRQPQAQAYLQRNYLKFGLTGYFTGLKLPAMDIPDGVKTKLTFDWSPMCTGSHNIDLVKLVVIVDNGGEETVFTVPDHDIANGEALRWITAEIDLGNSVTSKSRITIRNCDAQWPDPNTKAFRYFLDNLKVTRAF